MLVKHTVLPSYLSFSHMSPFFVFLSSVVEGNKKTVQRDKDEFGRLKALFDDLDQQYNTVKADKEKLELGTCYCLLDGVWLSLSVQLLPHVAAFFLDSAAARILLSSLNLILVVLLVLFDLILAITLCSVRPSVLPTSATTRQLVLSHSFLKFP